MPDCKVIVVGDQKTPKNYASENVEFLSYEDQIKYKIGQLLPVDHYSRKNIGYIHAIKHGAQEIFDTDDDNYPYKDRFRFPPFGKVRCKTPLAENFWCNVYMYYNFHICWPRGFPLDEVLTKAGKLKEKTMNVALWQGFSDLEPDLDAIYRMTSEVTRFKFERPRLPMALRSDQYCPTNSQNALFSKEAFLLLYLPCTVSFRFTDILRGLVMQQILGLYDLSIGFCNATVYQNRNEHDLMKDFESEIEMYLNSKKIPYIVRSVISEDGSMEENLLASYRELERQRIVKSDEVEILTAFIKEIS